MAKALYRKYRSKSLDEIIGQPHITTTLRNALAADQASHAYLFTGPRGVGKTSIARILAHELNSMPYSEDANHLDIIEIDAASNRRIDEIRELRERVHIAPTSSKYKVYIIDEVHMLTKEAFNALLKTLEEPPAHVVFILATTEAHKLPETIISRTQRFTFKPVEQSEVVAHLAHIAKQEDVTIDTAALELIAQHGGGSFRDSISMLDQVRGHATKVTLNDVQMMLGIAPDTLIAELVGILANGQASELIELLTRCKDQGYPAGQIAKQIAAQIRSELIAGNSSLDSNQLTDLLGDLLAVPAAHDPLARLELALLQIIMSRSPLRATMPPEPVPVSSKPKVEAKTAKTTEPVPTKPVADKKPSPEPITKSELPTAPAPKPAVQVMTVADDAIWNTALNNLKKTHNTLYSIARMAGVSLADDELTLTFGFAFHQKRMSETKNKQVITDIVQQASGRPITIVCLVGEVVKPTATKALTVDPPMAATVSGDALSTISNIFGSAEVLES